MLARNIEKNLKSKRKGKDMEEIRKMIKEATNERLLEIWVKDTSGLTNEAIAVNAIVETELEQRNLIKLNEDTFEYDVL